MDDNSSPPSVFAAVQQGQLEQQQQHAVGHRSLGGPASVVLPRSTEPDPVQLQSQSSPRHHRLHQSQSLSRQRPSRRHARPSAQHSFDFDDRHHPLKSPSSFDNRFTAPKLADPSSSPSSLSTFHLNLGHPHPVDSIPTYSANSNLLTNTWHYGLAASRGPTPHPIIPIPPPPLQSLPAPSHATQIRPLGASRSRNTILAAESSEGDSDPQALYYTNRSTPSRSPMPTPRLVAGQTTPTVITPSQSFLFDHSHPSKDSTRPLDSQNHEHPQPDPSGPDSPLHHQPNHQKTSRLSSGLGSAPAGLSASVYGHSHQPPSPLAKSVEDLASDRMARRLKEDEEVANQLLAEVDLNAALNFLQKQIPLERNPSKTPETSARIFETPLSQSPGKTQVALQTEPPQVDSGSAPTPQAPSAFDGINTPNRDTLLPVPGSSPLTSRLDSTPAHASSDSVSPAKNRSIRNISKSFLKNVTRKRDLTPASTPISTPSTTPAGHLQAILPQGLLDDDHHMSEREDPSRPHFTIDLRTASAATERFRGNPSQIRRVEECKRFFSLRYEPIFSALADGQPPPSLIKVAHWRVKMSMVFALRNRRNTIIAIGSSKEQSPNVNSATAISRPKYDGYKWICLSSRKRKTIWELCPEDLEAFIRAKGLIEGEEELSEAQDLLGKFDEHSSGMTKHSRQRANSYRGTRWLGDTRHSMSQVSEPESSEVGLSQKGDKLYHQTQVHLRNLSLESTTPHRGRLHSAGGGHFSSPDTSQRDLRSGHFSDGSINRDFSLLSRLPKSSLQSSSTVDSDADESRSHPGSRHMEMIHGLLLDTSGLFLGDNTAVNSPQGMSGISPSLSSPRPTRIKTSLKQHLFPIGVGTAPVSSLTSRRSSDQDSSMPKGKAHRNLQSRSWVGLGDEAEAGPNEKTMGAHRSQSLGTSDVERGESSTSRTPYLQQRKLIAMNKGGPMATSGKLLSPHDKPTPPLSRASSSKGILNFAKRSIVNELSFPSGPSITVSRQADQKHAKLSFLQKPPRDWLGWKFDRSSITMRTSEKAAKSNAEKQTPLADILFAVSLQSAWPLYPCMGSATETEDLGKGLLASVPILIIDIDNDDSHALEIQTVRMSTKVESSASLLKKVLVECARYQMLLPNIRQGIGLSPLETHFSDIPRILDEIEGKKTHYPSSVGSTASTTTEGSVLSRSSSFESEEVVQVDGALNRYMTHIEKNLLELEQKKELIKEELRQRLNARKLAIAKHEVFLASCAERQELMRMDRELVNQIKKKVKFFNQEGTMIDNTISAISNGISRPLITLLVSILTRVIGLSLKFIALHQYLYQRAFVGMICTLSFWTIHYYGKHFFKTWSVSKDIRDRLAVEQIQRVFRLIYFVFKVGVYLNWTLFLTCFGSLIVRCGSIFPGRNLKSVDVRKN